MMGISWSLQVLHPSCVELPRLLGCVAFGKLDAIASVVLDTDSEISNVKDSSGLWGGSN